MGGDGETAGLQRRETDGRQAEQLQCGPCRRKLQDEDQEELSPAQVRDHDSHYQDQGDLANYMCAGRRLGFRREGATPQSK